MLVSGTYFLNLLCALVPCQATMKPPEAHIADNNTLLESITPLYSQSLLNNSLDPISNDLSIAEVGSLNRPKRIKNGTSTTEASTTTLYPPRRYANLVNPVKTLMDAIRKGVEQSGGLTHNFGNPLVPFPDASPGNIKREIQPHKQGQMKDTRVYLRNGDAVEGYYMGTMKGKRIMAFQGIPYAEPPVGNLRFRKSVPKRPWRGILKATRTGSECLQGHPINMFRLSGSEDCLFLNVYTPKQTSASTKPEDKLLPVIFFIHGGSFMYGSGSEYGPAYLVDNNVVLVTFNYRLGPLGFLSTFDDNIRGNFGLHDQALALKWVHDNIQQFGGDPKKITIMGQSAGGVSAHIHLLANKTTNLFHNGISLSGSAFGFWPIVAKKRMLGFSKRLAKHVRCPSNDSGRLVECLRGMRPSFIVAASLHFFKWLPFHPLVVFAPVIEPEGPDAYLTRTPEELYDAGQVENKPWIFGQTSQEGHFETYMINLFMQTPILNARPKDMLPVILDYKDFTNDPQTNKLTNQIMKFYGAHLHNGIQEDSSVILNHVSEMYTDRIFTNTIQKAIRYHGSVSPVYAYLFDFMGKYNLGQVFGAAKSEWGVVHTEDLFYVFNSSVFHDGFRRNDPEYRLSEIMTNLISNFARHGEPLYTTERGNNVKIWDAAVVPKKLSSGSVADKRKQIEDLRIRYMKFNRQIEMIQDPFVERYQFWKTLAMKL